MLWSRLLAIADEMAVTLTRTAFSPIVRDAHDYGCAVFDATGAMVAMGEDATPGLSVSAMVSVRNMLQVFPIDTLNPGDVLITNDPWLATGHLLDLTIVTPVFHHGTLAGFTAAVAHHMDIGGRKTTPESTEVYEEGLFIPVLKLYDRGTLNETLMQILARNVRVPDMVLGDVHAQVTANALGARRIGEVLDENDWPNLNLIGHQVQARAEAAMRQAIERVPDGHYTGTMTIDGFDEDLQLVATIIIQHDTLTVDFTGTSPQVGRGINCVLPITQGVALLALQLALQPGVATNEGVMRPLTITAPEGSLLAARYPAPVVGRSLILDHIQPLIFTALAAGLPERVCAASGGPVWSERFYGHDSGDNPFFVLQLLNGGMGARSGSDGVSALSFPGNVATIPVDLFAEGAPLLVERKGLIPDSGGPGRNRGGLAQEFRVRVLPEAKGPVTVSIRADRTRNAAPGVFGGLPGQSGRVQTDDGTVLPPKRPIVIAAGDVLSWQLAGGGGYGSPHERDQHKVLADVTDGRVSPEAARTIYRIALNRTSTGEWEIDQATTNTLRLTSDGGGEAA